MSIVKGTPLIVLMFSVISSPNNPLPLVAATVSSPFSYNKLADKPSIFGSATYSITVLSLIIRKFFIPSFHETTSSLFFAFCMESIGSECLTLPNFSDGSAPTLRDGDVARTREGKLASILSIDLLRSSYSLSGILGLCSL